MGEAMKIGPGREPKRITISEAREVSQEEFAEARKSSEPVVQRFRETHHMMARCFAMGMDLRQISTAMGMSYNRVSMFGGDPAFQNLVAEYRLIVNAEWAETAAGKQALMEYIHGMGLRQVADQMEDAEGGQPIPIPTLLKVTADMADRLGYAKRTVNISVDGTFAAKLDRAIERSGLRQTIQRVEPKVIEGTALPTNDAVDLARSRAQPPEVEGAGASGKQESPLVPVLERRA